MNEAAVKAASGVKERRPRWRTEKKWERVFKGKIQFHESEGKFTVYIDISRIGLAKSCKNRFLANLGILKNVIHIRNTIGSYWKSNHMKSKLPNKSSDTCTVRGIELIDPPLGENPRPPGSRTRGSPNLAK